MKVSVVLAFLVVVFLAMVSAVPVLEDFQQEGLSLKVKESLEPSIEEKEKESGQGSRQRRATCDLLSFSTPIGSLNHSACAAHCLAMRKGFKGGRCRDGVCHCRR